MKRLMRLMLIAASMALLPALIFAGPAAAAKGGNKATVQECKERVAAAASGNLGQCVSEANRAHAHGPIPSRIEIDDQAVLLSDNTVLATVHYSCSAGNPGATITFKLNQRGTMGVGMSPATCDGGFNTAQIDVKPGPFTAGVAAAAVAELILPSGGGASEGDTIVPFPSSH